MGGSPARKVPPLVDERHRPTSRDVKPACGGTLVIEVPPLVFLGREPVSEGHVASRGAHAVAGVSPQTLRRWAQDGLVPRARDGRWTRAAVAQARIVARLRERGHSLEEIRGAMESGRLAFGFVEELLPAHERTHTLEEAAAETGLEPALIERIFLSMGFNAAALERISDDDLQLLRYVAAVLAAGFPLVALLQLVRVYGQALAQMADAEVRLFHLYVHEPLMREGVPGTRDGRGDGGPGPRAAAAGLADHGPRPPALPGALRRAGRHRAHGVRPRGRTRSTSGACAWRSPSPTSPATRA